jgi:ABC-type glycerol-3-phosphate transport system substrate-binding protein
VNKLYLMTFIYMILVLSSCDNLFGPKDEPSIEPPEMPAEIELTKAYYFDSGDMTQNTELKTEYSTWMSDRYGTNFKVNAFDRTDYMEMFATALSAGDIRGLGWIFGGSYAADYAAEGLSMVIQDDWLTGNQTWQSLPDGAKNEHRSSQGLAAIPSSYYQTLWFCRGIRADWLEAINMEKPTTVDELYSVVAAFTENDPDGDGTDNTTGMTSAGIWNLRDIFHSYDAHTDKTGQHCIIAGPNDEYVFVDGMLKPGAKDALTWLSNAYTAGYLDNDLFINSGSNIRDQMSSGLYGTCYYWASWGEPYGSWESRIQEVVPEAKMELILGLTSDRTDKNVNDGGNYLSGAPWILINGTEEPEKLINAFIHLYMTDEVSYWSGRYGVYDRHWEFGSDGEIVRLSSEMDEEGVCSYFPAPGIVGDFDPLGLTHLDYGYRQECWSTEEQTEYNEKLQIRADNMQQGQDSGLFFQYLEGYEDPPSDTYDSIAADIRRVFEESVAAAITGTKTIDQALDDYRTKMKALGAQDVLDEANAAIGKASIQEY